MKTAFFVCVTAQTTKLVVRNWSSSSYLPVLFSVPKLVTRRVSAVFPN